MSRCRACNTEMYGSKQSYFRTVKLETGEKIRIEEDLCRDCRNKVFLASDPEDFDLLEALGYDCED